MIHIHIYIRYLLYYDIVQWLKPVSINSIIKWKVTRIWVLDIYSSLLLCFRLINQLKYLSIKIFILILNAVVYGIQLLVIIIKIVRIDLFYDKKYLVQILYILVPVTFGSVGNFWYSKYFEIVPYYVPR
jgi:hypothetical protein